MNARACVTLLVGVIGACGGSCGGSTKPKPKPKPAAVAVAANEIVTVDECAKLALHFESLGEKESPTTGDDAIGGLVADVCIGHATRTSYACAMAAVDTETIMRCMESAIERRREGNHGELTAAQCDQVIDRVAAVAPEPLTEADRASLHARCMKEVTRNRYACIVGAHKPDDLERCAPTGQWR